jgi:hypothetical protein
MGGVWGTFIHDWTRNSSLIIFIRRHIIITTLISWNRHPRGVNIPLGRGAHSEFFQPKVLGLDRGGVAFRSKKVD